MRTSAAMLAKAAILVFCIHSCPEGEIHRRSARVDIVFYEPGNRREATVRRPMRQVRMAIGAFFLEDSANFIRHRTSFKDLLPEWQRCERRPMDARTNEATLRRKNQNAESQLVSPASQAGLAMFAGHA